MDSFLESRIYFRQITSEVILHKKKVFSTRVFKHSLPHFQTTYQMIGEELLRSGQLQKSVLPLKRVTIMAPHNSTAQIGLAKALFGLEKENEAFSSIKKALSISPESYSLHKFLIETLEERNRLEDLESFSKDILAMTADIESVSKFHFTSAEALLNCQKFPQALVTYRKAKEYNPPMGYNEHYNYGVSLYYEGLFEDALVQFEHALKSVPNEKHALNNIAHLNYCLGRAQKAREEYEYIIQNGLETTVTQFYFLLVLYHLDEDEEVINQCKNRLQSESLMQRLSHEQLRITQTILEKDNIDDKTREFNLKKLKGINYVLSFLEKSESNEGEEACD